MKRVSANDVMDTMLVSATLIDTMTNDGEWVVVKQCG